jgi:hypothetical protein
MFTADVISSSPTLALVSVEFNKVYWADPLSLCRDTPNVLQAAYL